MTSAVIGQIVLGAWVFVAIVFVVNLLICFWRKPKWQDYLVPAVIAFEISLYVCGFATVFYLLGSLFHVS